MPIFGLRGNSGPRSRKCGQRFKWWTFFVLTLFSEKVVYSSKSAYGLYVIYTALSRANATAYKVQLTAQTLITHIAEYYWVIIFRTLSHINKDFCIVDFFHLTFFQAIIYPPCLAGTFYLSSWQLICALNYFYKMAKYLTNDCYVIRPTMIIMLLGQQYHDLLIFCSISPSISWRVMTSLYYQCSMKSSSSAVVTFLSCSSTILKVVISQQSQLMTMRHCTMQHGRLVVTLCIRHTVIKWCQNLVNVRHTVIKW